MCRSLNIKIIRGSAYYPQSQGKVERSHRTLQKKIAFDLNNLSNVGVNRAKKLYTYQRGLNEEPMDVLGNISLFEFFMDEPQTRSLNKLMLVDAAEKQLSP